MYAQILLGVLNIGIGVGHLYKLDFLLKESIINNLSAEERGLFQKGAIIPHLLIGVTFIIGGIIENSSNISSSIIVGMYIIVGVISISLILLNNKKHFDDYFV